MKTNCQIGVIAPEADLQELIESVRRAASALSETLDLIPCVAGSTMATMVLAGADALIAGASIEVATDEQKLIRVLQTIREIRFDERRRSLLGVMLWGTRAPELADSADHAGLLSSTVSATAAPPQELLRTRLQEALPGLTTVNSETRYRLLAAAVGNVRLPNGGSTVTEISSIVSSVSATSEPKGFFNYLRSLLPSVQKKKQHELAGLHQLVSRLRQEQSQAARRTQQLEASQQHLKSLYNSLELEKERLHNENQSLSLQVEASADEHQRVLESARREMARASGESAAKIAESERQVGELSQQLSRREAGLTEIRQQLSEKEQLIETLHKQLTTLTTELESVSSELILVRTEAEQSHHAVKLAQAGALALRNQVIGAVKEALLTDTMLEVLTTRHTGALPRIETGPLHEQRGSHTTEPLPALNSQPQFTEPDVPATPVQTVQPVSVKPLVNAEAVAETPEAPAIADHKLTQNWNRVDLNELIQELKQSASSLIMGKRIQVDSEIEADATLVRSDAKLLREALFDLMTAAIYSTNEGMVMITARRTADSVTLSISDTGKGISKEKLKQIFSQDEGSQTSGIAETAIISVNRQASALNARLRVRSFPNFGTTVSLLLEPEFKVMIGSVGKLN